MRIDATIPDHEGKRFVRMARALGLSRSELVSEAVSYFLRIAAEVDAGRLLLLHDPSGGSPPRELVSRALVAPAPIAVPVGGESVLGLRKSRSADGAWRDELQRVQRLSPYERIAEAFELSDDRIEPA